MRQEILWQGEKARPLRVQRPCSCGCDTRDGSHGAGYLTGSDADGNGFTVWIQSEEVFMRLHGALNGLKSVR
jgi:hypothetical protein